MEERRFIIGNLQRYAEMIAMFFQQVDGHGANSRVGAIPGETTQIAWNMAQQC
ncbi:MAG: hypothetical protein IT165_09530 [Bryobacterales bacterium]|nr:hypothetical protein [Bryobacterales bacterium]